MRNRLLVSYLRLPEHPGKLRVVRALSRSVFPESGVVADVGSGLKLYLHPRDWIEYLLLRGIPYEPLTLAFIRENLEIGDGAILAGINFGLHAAVAASAVGDAGLAVGVDPQPSAILRARQNLELNRLESRVRLVAAALGEDQQLTAMAWSNPANAGAASLFDEGASFAVPMLRLESVLPLLASRRFRLLLLDVQGYELKVLRGLDLLQDGPEIAIVELDSDFMERARVSATAVVAPLLAAGYRLYDLCGREVTQLADDLPERNVVAIRANVSVRWGCA